MIRVNSFAGCTSMPHGYYQNGIHKALNNTNTHRHMRHICVCACKFIDSHGNSNKISVCVDSVGHYMQSHMSGNVCCVLVYTQWMGYHKLDKQAMGVVYVLKHDGGQIYEIKLCTLA